MAVYRYLAYDLIANTLITELPLSAVTYESKINGFGAFDANLFLSPKSGDAAIISAEYVQATQPQRTAIYIERDGSIVWGGIVWTRSYDPTSHTLTLGGAEFFSYFWRRTINATYSAASVEQHTIVRDLLNYAQAQANGSIGMLASTPNSGVVRDRTFYYYERKVIGEAIHQLSNVINGFDYAVDVAYVGTVPTKTFTMSYPRRGRIQALTGHVLEVGRNIVVISWPEDGGSAANRIHAIGAGDADARLISIASDTNVLSAGYPLLEDMAAFIDVTVQATLDSHAAAIVAARSMPIVLPQITIRSDLDPVFGSYMVGDDVRIRVQAGIDPRFYGGLDVLRRIIGWQVRVPDTGATENVTLTMGEVP